MRGRYGWFVAAVCCAVVPPAQRPGDAQSRPVDAVTFAKQIAPLLFDRCGGCHRPDGPAPFSLLTYGAAKQRATLIASVTKRQLMPPWKSEPGYGEFVGQRHLTASEIGLIQQWVAGGALEGDPRDLPPPPKWTAGWRLGTPDLIVSLPQPYVVRAAGPDFSRTFVLRLPVDRPRYVRGFEFQPGPAGVVHHANIRIDPTPASRALFDEDGERGYEGLLPSAVYPDGFFLGWTPGQVAPLLPTGLAWRLNPNTDLVVEMHFVPNGKPQPVQPSVALYFTNEVPTQTPSILRLGRQNIDIPPGQNDYVTTDSFVLPVDVDVIAVQPHAHYRAREIVGTATRPDGSATPLIYIKDWDYRWQHVYQYVTPLTLPKGTTLSMRFTFDNSAQNLRNPHQPPTRVHWGQQSTDEMGDLWVQMLTRDDRDRRLLDASILPKHRAEEIVGYEVRIRQDPAQVALHNEVARLYGDARQFGQAVAHFKTVTTLEPESAAAHYNLGTALLSDGQARHAIEEYREALRLNPEYVPAHNNLGNALLVTGNLSEALEHFQTAERLDPADGDAYYNVGTLLLAQADAAAAVDSFREAVRRQPDAIAPLANLAWALAILPAPPAGSAEEAIGLAERAAALSERRDPRVLNALAAAQAAADHFDLAVSTCEAALALKPDAPLAAAIRERQLSYRQHRRYVLLPPSR